jgi:hypothetical protein
MSANLVSNVSRAAANPQVISVALNGASPLAGVIWQDDVTTTGMYSAIAEQDPTTDTPALHGTGLHTFPARKETFALFAVYTKGFTSDFTLFDYTAFDNSYSDFGDSGNAGGTSANAVHAWAPRRQNASMTANGVTATANQAGNVEHVGAAHHPFERADRRRPDMRAGDLDG